eukprot:scaffold8010_cov69-Phaeocystis_antarctica.AAC.1
MSGLPPETYAGASSCHHQCEGGTPAPCVRSCAAVTERSHPSSWKLLTDALTLHGSDCTSSTLHRSATLGPPDPGAKRRREALCDFEGAAGLAEAAARDGREVSDGMQRTAPCEEAEEQRGLVVVVVVVPLVEPRADPAAACLRRGANA